MLREDAGGLYGGQGKVDLYKDASEAGTIERLLPVAARATEYRSGY